MLPDIDTFANIEDYYYICYKIFDIDMDDEIEYVKVLLSDISTVWSTTSPDNWDWLETKQDTIKYRIEELEKELDNEINR